MYFKAPPSFFSFTKLTSIYFHCTYITSHTKLVHSHNVLRSGTVCKVLLSMYSMMLSSSDLWNAIKPHQTINLLKKKRAKLEQLLYCKSNVNESLAAKRTEGQWSGRHSYSFTVSQISQNVMVVRDMVRESIGLPFQTGKCPFPSWSQLETTTSQINYQHYLVIVVVYCVYKWHHNCTFVIQNHVTVHRQ